MKFKVYSDDDFELVLIKGSAVRDVFDQSDLSMRQNADSPLLDKYHKNWILNDIILVPSFYIKSDEVKVGMGHHRFTMLSKHMEFIPAAFERRHSESNNLKTILSKIVVRKMKEFEEFEYPDFPIDDLGPDSNGGTDWKKHLT